MSVIKDIFNEVQRSAQTHKLCIKKLAAAINTRGPQEQENLTYFLHGGIDRILLHVGAGANMDRSISFLGSFLAAVDDRILLLTMKHLCSRLQSSNKLVRQRICQITCRALEALCEAKIDLSEDLFAELSAHMISRLKDKVPAVRIWAVKALKFLQVPEEEEDSSTVELKRVMRSDSSATVRVAAVEILTLTDGSKHDLCARLKDVKSEVRVAVLNRLASETDMRQFTVQMRAEILRSALEDREEVVRSAVLGLIWKWLALVDTSNVPKFLNLLNPAENEEAALLVGATIVEELLKSEATQHAKMKRALRDSFFKWNTLAANGTAGSLTPSDVLWIQIRCSYARQFLPVFPASEICDALLPDAVALCTVLKDVKATLIVPSQHHSKQSSILKAQFVVKYLLNLAPLLIGNTDISGLSQLLAECADTFLNTNVTLPWDCVESALRAHTELHLATGPSVESHRAVLEMATNLREEVARLAEPVSEEDAANGSSPEVPQKLLLAITERCLQLTHWALQQELSIMACKGKTGTDGEEEDSVDESSVSPFTTELPFILQGLQQPSYQLRYLAVSCLGLLCLVDPKLCDSYRGVILQVASGDFEDTSIRSQALQSLVDFSIVFRGKYVDDVDLGNVLLRMQESGEPETMLVAAEAACKLLHSGTHHEPRLFANLLKFFFLTESLPEANPSSGKLTPSSGNEGEDFKAAQEEFEHRVFLANCARLQQILSIFFHVFTTTDVIADQVVAESIPYLVADMTNEIKDGTVEPVALSKILKHLFSLCENKIGAPETPAVVEDAEIGEEEAPAQPVPASASADASLALVRATTAAALSKELLKLGSSKLEKAIDKEYVKIFVTLSLETWIANYDVASVERVVDTIMVCSTHDRTVNKHLDLLMQICVSPDLHTPNSGIKSAVEFVHLAPGLTDLIELAARSSVLDQSVDEGASLCGDDISVGGLHSLPGSAVKPRAAVRRPVSATKARAVPSPAPTARLSTSRSARASRPSYAESDDLDSDLEEESDSEESESSGSESDAEEPEPTAEDVRNATMSPTKQFVLNSTGKTKKVVAKKSSAVKKISFADDGEGPAVKGRKAVSKKAAD